MELRKITKIFSKVSSCRDRDSNPAPPDISADQPLYCMCSAFGCLASVCNMPDGDARRAPDAEELQLAFCTGWTVFLHTELHCPLWRCCFCLKSVFFMRRGRAVSRPSWQVFPEWCRGWGDGAVHLANSQCYSAAIHRRLDGKDPLIEIKGAPPTTPRGHTIIIWRCRTFVGDFAATLRILYFSLTFAMKWQLRRWFLLAVSLHTISAKFPKETSFLYVFTLE